MSTPLSPASVHPTSLLFTRPALFIPSHTPNHNLFSPNSYLFSPPSYSLNSLPLYFFADLSIPFLKPLNQTPPLFTLLLLLSTPYAY